MSSCDAVIPVSWVLLCHPTQNQIFVGDVMFHFGFAEFVWLLLCYKKSKLTEILIEDKLCGWISKIRFSIMSSMDSGLFWHLSIFHSLYRLAVFKCDMTSSTTLSLPATCWNFILYCCSLSTYLSIDLPFIRNGANGLWSQYKVYSAPVRKNKNLLIGLYTV